MSRRIEQTYLVPLASIELWNRYRIRIEALRISDLQEPTGFIQTDQTHARNAEGFVFLIQSQVNKRQFIGNKFEPNIAISRHARGVHYFPHLVF